MARINTEALAALGKVLSVEGGQVPTRTVDLESSVPLVMDVSRLTQMGRTGSAFMGFTNFSIANSHTVPGETTSGNQSTIASAAFWASLGLQMEQSWLWILEATARRQASLVVTEAAINIQQAIYTGAFTSHQRLIWRGITSTAVAVAGGADLLMLPTVDLAAERPILVPPNASINFTTAASGAAASITAQIQAWAGPKGVLPPGLS